MSEIQKKNDELRSQLPIFPRPHRLVMTQGIRAEFSAEDILEILMQIKNTDKFDDGDDPWKEHDFGSFVFKDERIYWKFDYYDDELEYFKENGTRVLTVMLASEY